jgi:hypothetical protein
VFAAGHPDRLQRFGFTFGRSGAHAARTMMLGELQRLLDVSGASATRADYRAAVVDRNVLDKPTTNARRFTFTHLRSLYALEPDVCLFRNFRTLWYSDAYARPVLALQMALTRDALLRHSLSLVLDTAEGQCLAWAQTEALLTADQDHPLSAASVGWTFEHERAELDQDGDRQRLSPADQDAILARHGLGEAIAVDLPRRTLTDEAELAAWVKEAERRIRDKLADGPVVV